MAGNLAGINGSLFTVSPFEDLKRSLGQGGFGIGPSMKPDYLKYLQGQGIISPFQGGGMQQQSQMQGAMAPQSTPPNLANQYNRLSQNASDALYGGILGYQPKPITSPTGNQYQPPANQGFQFPFGLLNRNFMGGQ
jgi:hypothetical protein